MERPKVKRWLIYYLKFCTKIEETELYLGRLNEHSWETHLFVGEIGSCTWPKEKGQEEKGLKHKVGGDVRKDFCGGRQTPDGLPVPTSSHSSCFPSRSGSLPKCKSSHITFLIQTSNIFLVLNVRIQFLCYELQRQPLAAWPLLTSALSMISFHLHAPLMLTYTSSSEMHLYISYLRIHLKHGYIKCKWARKKSFWKEGVKTPT